MCVMIFFRFVFMVWWLVLVVLIMGIVGILLFEVLGVNFVDVEKFFDCDLGILLLCVIFVSKVIFVVCVIGFGVSGGIIGFVMVIGMFVGVVFLLFLFYFINVFEFISSFVFLGIVGMFIVVLYVFLVVLFVVMELLYSL